MNEKNLDFIIFLIYQLSEAWDMPVYKVYSLLDSSGALQKYIIPCWEALHTLGREYLVEDITGYVQDQGYVI